MGPDAVQGTARPRDHSPQCNAEAQARLISDILDVARITSNKLHLDPQLLDVSDVVKLLVEDVEAQANDDDVQVTASAQPHVTALADPARLQKRAMNRTGEIYDTRRSTVTSAHTPRGTGHSGRCSRQDHRRFVSRQRSAVLRSEPLRCHRRRARRTARGRRLRLANAWPWDRPGSRTVPMRVHSTRRSTTTEGYP